MLRDHIPISDSTKPEDDHLQSPSAFTMTQQTGLGLADLTAIEYDLHEGQAHDALHAVREAIKTFNYNLAYKKKQISMGNELILEPNHFCNPCQRIRFLQLISAGVLLKLGLPEDDKVLQPLHDNQLWMKNVNEPWKLGETVMPDPWIWTVGHPKGMSKEQEAYWSQDSPCVCLEH
jgi:hypothetical protein